MSDSFTKEKLPSAEFVDVYNLYTGESTVTRKGLEDTKNVTEPILFGLDKTGTPYITDGNHRAYNSLVNKKPLLGYCISKGNFEVRNNPNFRTIDKLRVI